MSSRPERQAHVLASFRWLEVRGMEILAAWVPSTPEMEIKLLFGEHLYLMARHADALGHRTRELRAPLHHTLAPREAYVRLVEEVAGAESTGQRLDHFHGALLPAMERRYRAHLAQLDPLLDGPTVRILEEVLVDLQGMATQADGARCQLGAPDAPDPAGADWTRREKAVSSWCAGAGTALAGGTQSER